MGETPGFAPKETFLEILKWVPIPTFDLIIEYGDQGIILVRRKIAPYKDVWALPGLRKLKGESLDETLERIARDELGLAINPKNRRFVDQFVAQFEGHNQREDISTCYVVQTDPAQLITANAEHFYEFKILFTNELLPEPLGDMYGYFIEKYTQS